MCFDLAPEAYTSDDRRSWILNRMNRSLVPVLAPKGKAKVTPFIAPLRSWLTPQRNKQYFCSSPGRAFYNMPRYVVILYEVSTSTAQVVAVLQCAVRPADSDVRWLCCAACLLGSPGILQGLLSSWQLSRGA